MVNHSSPSLDRVFSALSDPTRRAILERLARSEASVTELAAPFAMSLSAISKHLRILEQAGLIAREKEGRIHHMRLAARQQPDDRPLTARHPICRAAVRPLDLIQTLMGF